MPASLLSARDLSVGFGKGANTVGLTHNVSFDLAEGESVAIVGESGSGKTLTMLGLVNLLPPGGRLLSGEVVFRGEVLSSMREDELRRRRGRHIGFVFQDPSSSLNPVLPVGLQVMEPMLYHLHLSRRAARDKAAELFELVGIPGGASRLNDYPHQLSGGMRQRVMIATALSCKPDLLIADEPTTALDVTTQSQIVTLVGRLKQQMRMAMLWVTHDLQVAAAVADRIIVFHRGRIVEDGAANQVLQSPVHAYTRALLKARPTLDGPPSRRLPTLSGLEGKESLANSDQDAVQDRPATIRLKA